MNIHSHANTRHHEHEQGSRGGAVEYENRLAERSRRIVRFITRYLLGAAAAGS